jgi:hypothetical protein
MAQKNKLSGGIFMNFFREIPSPGRNYTVFFPLPQFIFFYNRSAFQP